MNHFSLKYITAVFFLLAIAAINLFIVQSKILGVLFVFVYSWFMSAYLGRALMPGYHKSWQRITGFLGLISGFITVSAAGYYIFGLTDAVLIFSLAATALLAPIISLIHTWRTRTLDTPQDDTTIIAPRTLGTWISYLIVLVGDYFLIDYLSRHGTQAAIRSPWSEVSGNFFILFFITSFCILRILKRHAGKRFAVIATCLHTGVLLSVGYFIYQLGFGFDPFIHRAAEEYIAKAGILYPLTPFYIGQYALVAALGKLTFLPIAAIDKALLPFLEIIFLPQLAYMTLRYAFNCERTQARIASVLFFIVPFASFVTTTPYELAAFFSIAVLMYAAIYLYTNTLRAMPLILITLGAFAIHPLAGIPALIINVSAILAGKIPTAGQTMHAFLRIAHIIISIAALFAIPFAFLAYLKLQTGNFGALPALSTVIARLPSISFPVPRQGFDMHTWLTPLYWYYFIAPVLFFIITVYGFYLWRRIALRRAHSAVWFFPILYFIFITNAIIIRLFIRLPGIGDHEQFQYSNRLMHFAVYLLMPFFLYGITHALRSTEIRYARTVLMPLAYIALAGALAASLYASYPRVDAYMLGKFINTSTTDMHSVRAIANFASGEPYIVLSNISTAAAALQEFGFTPQSAAQPAYFRTSEGNVYFYSIPTGGPLYIAYLHMAEQNPGRNTADYIRNLTGARRVFLVINQYWHTFNKITPLAKQAADEWFDVDNGKALVFVYK